MNPQYLPPSQFGGPTQGYMPGKQGSGLPQQGSQESFGSTQPPPGGYMQQPLPLGYNKGQVGPPNTQNNIPSLPNMQQGSLMQAPPTNMPQPSTRPMGMLPNNFNSQPPQMRQSGLPTPTQNGPIMNQGPPEQSPQRQVGRSPGPGQIPPPGTNLPPVGPLTNQVGSLPGSLNPSGPSPAPGSHLRLSASQVGLPPGPVNQMNPPGSQVNLTTGPVLSPAPIGHLGLQAGSSLSSGNQIGAPASFEPPADQVPSLVLPGPPFSQSQFGGPPLGNTQLGGLPVGSQQLGPPVGFQQPGSSAGLQKPGHVGLQQSAPPVGLQKSGPGMPPSNLGPMGYPPGPSQGQLAPTNTQGKPLVMPPLPGSNIPPINTGMSRNIPPQTGQYSNKPLGTGYQGIQPPGQLPSQINQNYNQPHIGSNNPPVVNQIVGQINDMNLSGNRQYPSMKSAINGDNSPHMPPPLAQAQYLNGAQSRGPQGPMGYQPMQAQQQMPGGPYPPQPSYQQQQQQARRLDPDQMPSPIQVTLDDQKTRSGIFCTNQKGLVPPLVSTSFITQDQGNAGPRFIRSTMYNVPTTSDMMKQTSVPFGLVISPFARTLDQEYPPPIVDFGELGPVRCIRCKAYMSPFMQFIDSGRRFQCLFCKATTEVPTEYFQHLDHTGQRVDRYERPELILGAYEFVATKDYCRNNIIPKPPAIIFVIDVSYNNVKSGLVHLLCAEMKEILKNLPIDQNQEKSRMKVGFITYNSTVHFYNIKGTLAQPQMMVVGDIQEMFMPLLDGFLCDIEDSAAVIDSLMQQIPAMFAETRETETVLLPAIQAGLEALKASECAGKLLVFHSTLPTSEAPGRLKNRDERKLLGTDKERTVLTPQTQAYNQLGQDCVAAGCSVDLFITNNSYVDIATIGQVARLTGGEIFKYTYFQADIDGQRLVNDVIMDISRPVAFDSIMRVRTSTGVRPTDFYGHFFMSNTTDMEIAAIDCDKAVAIEIKHDDKLTEEEGVYIQVALLYTSCAGQRRLRILNLSLKTCSQMADLYRSCELDTIVNFFSKQCIYRLLDSNPKTVKDSMINRCAQTLACYRKNCASPSSAGQLILPECMKLLPLYVNCLLKSDAISGGSDLTLDDRSFVMQAVTTMDVPSSVVYFYPRLIPLHEIQNGSETSEIPSSIRCTVEKMTDNGVYLLENGIHMLLWIGLNANQEWMQSVFGVPSAAQVDLDRLQLPELDNSLSVAIRNLIDQIRAQRHRCMRLTLVRQRDKLETVFRHFLVEDRGQDGSSSYVDFLCHMHKEIRQLLS